MIVVDVETTGTDSSKHEIINIGALDFDNPANLFYEDLRVLGPMENDSPEAFEVNGYNSHEIREPARKHPDKAVRDFLEWASKIHDITPAGHNPGFDVDFLSALAKRHNVEFHFGHRFNDLHGLCYSHYKRRGILPPLKNRRTDIDSDKVMIYVGLPPESKPHRSGLTGAKLEAEAFSRFFHGKPLFEEYKECPVPDYLRV